MQHYEVVSSSAEALEEFLVAFDESLGAGGEVFVGSDTFDLGCERVNDELVDAVASNARNGFGFVGEFVGQAYSGLLRHDIMIT